VPGLLGDNRHEPPALRAGCVELGVGPVWLAMGDKLVLPAEGASPGLPMGGQQLLEVGSGVRYELSVGIALAAGSGDPSRPTRIGTSRSVAYRSAPCRYHGAGDALANRVTIAS
jgi:hypothetical protein